MTKKFMLILLVLILIGAIGVIASAGQGQTIPVNMTLTGTIISIADGKGIFDVNVKGQPGTGNVKGLSFTIPVLYDQLPEDNECFDLENDENLPFDAFEIQPGGQFNMIFRDGSMLFGTAAAGGYVCVAPNYAFAPYDLAGGLGRYEGATGYVNFSINTHSFGAPGSAVVPETGTASGEIMLP